MASLRDEALEAEVEFAMAVVRTTRSMRADYQLTPKTKTDCEYGVKGWGFWEYSSPSLIPTTRDRRNRFELTGVRINRGPEVEMFNHLSGNDG